MSYRHYVHVHMYTIVLVHTSCACTVLELIVNHHLFTARLPQHASHTYCACRQHAVFQDKSLDDLTPDTEDKPELVDKQVGGGDDASSSSSSSDAQVTKQPLAGGNTTEHVTGAPSAAAGNQANLNSRSQADSALTGDVGKHAVGDAGDVRTGATSSDAGQANEDFKATVTGAEVTERSVTDVAKSDQSIEKSAVENKPEVSLDDVKVDVPVKEDLHKATKPVRIPEKLSLDIARARAKFAQAGASPPRDVITEPREKPEEEVPRGIVSRRISQMGTTSDVDNSSGDEKTKVEASF